MPDDQLDLREQIARIDRAIAETGKLLAERKLKKETYWFPWLQITTMVVSSATIGAVASPSRLCGVRYDLKQVFQRGLPSRTPQLHITRCST